MAATTPSTTTTDFNPRIQHSNFIEFELAAVRQENKFVVTNDDMNPVYVKLTSSNPSLVKVPTSSVKIKGSSKRRVAVVFAGARTFDDIPAKISIKVEKCYDNIFHKETTTVATVDTVFTCAAYSSPDKKKK